MRGKLRGEGVRVWVWAHGEMCKLGEGEFGKLRNTKRSRTCLRDIHGNHNISEGEVRGILYY